MSDKNFVDGMLVKLPDNNAPDFVKLKLSFKLDEFGAWVSSQKKQDADLEWINIEIKEGRSGKWYAERNMYKPEPKPEPRPELRDVSQTLAKEDIPW